MTFERKTRNGKTYIVGYHTQSWQPQALEEPELCSYCNAWLGQGVYFWVNLQSAHNWGEDFKDKGDGYQVYTALLDTEKCLNTTFSEDDYKKFCYAVENVIEDLSISGKKPTLQQVHQYLKEKFWQKMGIRGIIYDDLPMNPYDKQLKSRTKRYSQIYYEENEEIKFFYYQKRIQIVMFFVKDIDEFEVYD